MCHLIQWTQSKQTCTVKHMNLTGKQTDGWVFDNWVVQKPVEGWVGEGMGGCGWRLVVERGTLTARLPAMPRCWPLPHKTACRCCTLHCLRMPLPAHFPLYHEKFLGHSHSLKL
jgi:hypothetical protein